jgi:hypothetical protein
MIARRLESRKARKLYAMKLVSFQASQLPGLPAL